MPNPFSGKKVRRLKPGEPHFGPCPVVPPTFTFNCDYCGNDLAEDDPGTICQRCRAEFKLAEN